MLNRYILTSSALIAAAVLAGCSSSIDPVAQTVAVSSSPDDAIVTINGKVMDRTTDTTFVLNRDQDYVIVVSKTGYKPATTRIGHIATGAEAPGAPRFELTESKISVTLEEDASSPTAEKTDTLASEKIARDEAEAKVAREAAEAKADEEAKVAAEAKIKAEHEASEAKAAADAKAKAEQEAADMKAAEEAKEAAEAKAKTEHEAEEAKAKAEQAEITARAEAKAKAEEESAKEAAIAKASAEASAEATAKAAAATDEKVADLGTQLSASEKNLASANEKIANLETQLDQAKDTAAWSAKASPVAASAKARSSSDILARYKTLRSQLKSGEITKAEYDKAVSAIAR